MSVSMNITLIDIWLNRHSQSWIALLSIELGFLNIRHLFYIEWDYEKQIHYFEILFIKFR